MDTRANKQSGRLPARAAPAVLLCGISALSILAPPAQAGDTEKAQAMLLYTRITGAPPNATDLSTMETALVAGNKAAAVAVATSAPNFYNVTLRNIFAAESNRDQ